VKDADIYKHNLMIAKSLAWWEDEMVSCSDEIRAIEIMVESCAPVVKKDKLKRRKEQLMKKFGYLLSKGDFETRLLEEMEIETKKMMKRRHAKKKRK
jgi:hypothetical protein